MKPELLDKIERAYRNFESASENLGDLKEQKKKIDKYGEKLLRARIIAQNVAKQVQQKIHQQISVAVTEGLQSIFDDPYEFKINFEEKRGKTEAEIVLVRNGEQFDPLESCGYGVLDIASFILRLSSVLLQRPTKRKLLILDEPFRYVSQNYRTRVADLMENLADKFGFQIIMVTHANELAVGTKIRLE